MFSVPRIWLMVACAALVLGTPGIASANWITIKNNLGTAIVVQETVVVGGQVKRGKATNLLPGETLREYLPTPTVKRVEVYDSRRPDRPAWSGTLDCPHKTQAFSISSSGGKVTVTPLAVPRRR